ncbi:MarR family winged helix-turn-helix transcriptional regulator [Kineosporia sp. R_H_3]|uniref:MarR family winged helix-turn-helix transcriptional regulator n=1 Tax=Kineosporia sp. R_H_3 TaxID=1961848 RepID=UPI0018E9F9D3|nr:MarR family transcriptional regulator [Kineosporia sp. R_H_3]
MTDPTSATLAAARAEEPPGAAAGPGPRWLTDAEQQVWRGLMPVLHELPAALDRQLQSDAGIPHTYYVIMAMLSEAPGHELRMSELSQVTANSLSRLSHAVARLEGYGWVRRRKCPTDRRGQIAMLTDAGMAKVVELAPGHVAAVRRFVFDALSPEQVETLGRISSAITEAIGSAGPGTPGDGAVDGA